MPLHGRKTAEITRKGDSSIKATAILSSKIRRAAMRLISVTALGQMVQILCRTIAVFDYIVNHENELYYIYGEPISN